MKNWPKISIVTPSYNQAQFLEKTILSVLNQNYPNLEYIIIDGGSTDGSVEIIKKYERYLAYWVSEKDNGQSDAINKGFLKSTGEILAWQNADDLYEPNAFMTVGKYFSAHPEVDVLYGDFNLIDGHGRVIRRFSDVGFNERMLVYGAVNINSPAAFFRRKAFTRSGMLRKELFFAMDYDLWLRMSLWGAQFAYLKKTLGNFRLHDDSKTSRHWTVCIEEVRKLRRELFGLDDRSLSFRVRRWLYRLKRIALFVQQGNVKYVWDGVRARVWAVRDRVPPSPTEPFEGN